MKYTIKWESDGKKEPIIWEKYELQFPRFSVYDEFCYVFLYYGKLMGKPIQFPYDKVYRRMGILLGKITHTMGKVWVPISQAHPIRTILLHFPVLWKLMRKPVHFRYAEIYHRMGIGWKKNTHIMGKVSLQISQIFPIPQVLLHFPVLWEIYGETHAFPICWSVP